MMEMVMGRMPEKFSRKGAASKPEFFKDGARLDWPKPKATKQSRRDVKATKALSVSQHIPILSLSSCSEVPQQDIVRPQDQLNRAFLELVRQLLEFDPSHRLTVRKALEHPYFSLPAPRDF